MKSGKFLAFNRRVLNAALASAVVLGGAGFGVNAYAASVNGVTSATVLIPIAIANTTTLAFGKFTNVAQNITVTPAGGRTSTVSNSLLATGSTAAHAAGAVTVTGDADASYSITLTPAVLTKAVTLETMTLSLITVADAISPGTLITVGKVGGTVGTSGTQILKVGATLAVSAAQVAGVYAGSYNVAVEYN